eukprot:s6300_g4.t1
MLGRRTPAAIKEFWEHLQRFAPEEVKDHPALDGCDVSKMVPLLIHFDGAEMYKNSEYNIWSFSSALSSLLDVDCLETKMVPLLIHFDGAEMYKNSEYNIWSFSSALSSLLDVDCLETQFVCCILPQKAMQQKQA